jgi:hypothetical protein
VDGESSLDAKVSRTSASYRPEVPFTFFSFSEAVKLSDNLTTTARLEGLLGGLLGVAHDLI